MSVGFAAILKILYQTDKVSQRPIDRSAVRHLIEDPEIGNKHMPSSRSARVRADIPEDPRLKIRPPEPPGPAPAPKKSKDKSAEKVKKYTDEIFPFSKLISFTNSFEQRSKSKARNARRTNHPIRMIRIAVRIHCLHLQPRQG